MQLVGYWTSQKEIRDFYQEVYLLRRLPSLPPCRPQQREEAIQDILSSLRSHLHRWESTAILEEDQWVLLQLPPPICQLESSSWSWRREDPLNEALQEAREAHRWVLEITHMLELNIERLSQGVESAQYQCPCSHNNSHLQSRSLDRWERSLGRHDRFLNWHRLEWCMTFWDPEVEPVSSKRSYRGPKGHSIGTQLDGGNGGPLSIWRPETVHPWEMPTTYMDIGNRMGYLPEPSIRNYEIWLDWQACQLDTPHWWAEFTTIPEVADPRRLAWKSTLPSWSWQLGVRPSQAKITTCPLSPNVSPGVGFSPVTLPIRMSNGSPCYWLWLTPKHCNIGQRKSDCQASMIIALWQWVWWN